MKRIFITGAFILFAVIVNAQNVGIGTTTPSEKLTISSGNISLLSSSKGILLNGFDGPMINRGFDPFISGNYTGLGRWGLFMEPNNLTLGIPAIGLKAFAVSSYKDNSTIIKQLFNNHSTIFNYHSTSLCILFFIISLILSTRYMFQPFRIL